MKSNRFGCTEDLLFIAALLIPLVVGGARYIESDRQMTEIAQAQEKRNLAAAYERKPQARSNVVARASIGG